MARKWLTDEEFLELPSAVQAREIEEQRTEPVWLTPATPDRVPDAVIDLSSLSTSGDDSGSETES